MLVTARNDTSANWAIHANMDTDMFDTVPDTLNPSTSRPSLSPRACRSLTPVHADVTSSITYNASASLTDLGFVDEYTEVDDVSLVPVEVVPMPNVTKTIELEVTFDTMDDGTNHAMFNQITYNMPLVPAVFSELTLGDNATVEEAYGPLSFVVNYLEVVDIVIKNGDAGKHPLYVRSCIVYVIY